MIEELESTVNVETRTVTIELEHFSTYVVADNASKPRSEPAPEPKPDDTTMNPETADYAVTAAFMVFVCAGACIGIVTVFRKKAV